MPDRRASLAASTPIPHLPSRACILTRRHLLKVAVSAAAGVALASCAAGPIGRSAPPPAALSGTVQFWYDGVSQTAIDAYNAMANDFKQVAPRVSVQFALMGGIDKLITSFAGGAPPDGFRMQVIDALTAMPKGLYAPLDTAIKQQQYNVGDLWPGLADQFDWQGKHLALADNINTTVLFYNADLFHQADLPTPNDLTAAKKWTWDAFLSTAQKLTKADTYGVWNLTSPQSLGAWVWMNGGDMFDNADHPTKLTMSRPETVEAVQFNSDLRTRYRVAPTPDQLNALVKSSSDAVQLFYQGKLGMYVQLYIGQALVNGVKGAFQWDVAPLPSGKAGLFDWPSSQAIGASAPSKQLDATIDWLFFVAGPTGQKEYQSRQLGLPVLRSMTSTPAWKQAPGVPPHVDAVVQLMQAFKPLARTALWRPLATDAFNPNINKLMNGQLSAQEACAAMDEAGAKAFASAAVQSGSATTK